MPPGADKNIGRLQIPAAGYGRLGGTLQAAADYRRLAACERRSPRAARWLLGGREPPAAVTGYGFVACWVRPAGDKLL